MKVNKPLSPFTALLLGAAFSIMGFILLFKSAIPNYLIAKQSKSWPTTMGVIEKSEIVKGVSSGEKKQTTYGARVSYSYQVDNNKLVGNQIYAGSNGSSSSNPSQANNYIAKYPIGKEVTVFYSPEIITDAILEPGVNTGHYLMIGAGVVFFLIGLTIFTLSLFKFAIFAATVGALVHSFVSKKDPKVTSIKSSKNKRNSPRDEINLEDEMSQYNKVASSSISPTEEPWNHQWMIKGPKKEHGPFAFKKVQEFYQQGKIKDHHQCYSMASKELITISDIMIKKAS